MGVCVLLCVCLALLLCLSGSGRACLDPADAYRFTGTVCRITYPAAVVLNEKTTQVIQAAFQHARYPSMQDKKELPLIGWVEYGLHNLEINNLTIGKSEFDLREAEGISITISNVSAMFKGTLRYGYKSWLIKVAQSVDFEIESQIDLGINTKLYCGDGFVAADTSDCYLTFHKLQLLLQGDREPGWLKRLFTEFVTFTAKLVIKGQICKEINSMANILATFVQERAEQFLSDGNITMDISVTAAPVITHNYIESYHKGLMRYHDETVMINGSVFDPTQLRMEPMLSFWISDEILQPLVRAGHQDSRYQQNFSGPELRDLFRINMTTPMPEPLTKLLLSDGMWLRAQSVAVPSLNTSPAGTTVTSRAALELCSPHPDTTCITMETEVEVLVRASYADKRLILMGKPIQTSILKASTSEGAGLVRDDVVLGTRLQRPSALPQYHHPMISLYIRDMSYLQEAVERIGIPTVMSYLEAALTALMNRQGLHLFDIINPEVVPHHGFLVVQTDFGFPHHLLVEFLRRTLD